MMNRSMIPVRTPRLLFLASIACLGLLMSGCVGLRPRPDPTRYYVLSGESIERSQGGPADLLVRRAEAGATMVR